MRTIGLIVNPVAGMGGSVGLKGTDGAMYAKAVELGATPVSPLRVQTFLAHLADEHIRWLVAPGRMGADLAAAAGLRAEVVGELEGPPSAADTRRLARTMQAAGAELIAFAGGDGTARDIADAIDAELPVVAIPAGVKVYSSVFAYSPAAAAELLRAFLDGADVEEQEVLDIDEDAYREGRIDARHYGFLLVPASGSLVQAGKEASGGDSTAEAKREIAAAIVEAMQPDTLYLLGSGTTIAAVAEELGVTKTLLGIDAVAGGELVARDVNERAILDLLDRYRRVKVVVTPLGGNGFIFGRGNKQFTADVLRRIGRGNVIVVANRDKLLKLPALHVDTGDEALDAGFRGFIDVLVGRSHRKLMRVE